MLKMGQTLSSPPRADPNRWGILAQLYRMKLIPKEYVAGLDPYGPLVPCLSYPRCTICPPPYINKNDPVDWIKYSDKIMAFTPEELIQFLQDEDDIYYDECHGHDKRDCECEPCRERRKKESEEWEKTLEEQRVARAEGRPWIPS